MTNRSRAYFKECKRGKKAIAEGGYWIRQRKPVILFGGSFAEMRKWRKYRNKLLFYHNTNTPYWEDKAMADARANISSEFNEVMLMPEFKISDQGENLEGCDATDAK